MSNDDIDGELVKITTWLKKLAVVCSENARKLHADKVKAEKL